MVAAVSNNAATTETASAVAKKSADLNFDTFIKLLTTQLQNQDPLNPMDGTAMTEQIATFSALEQQIQTNELLEKMVASDTFGAQSLAVSYIGKEALVPSNSANLVNGEMNFSYKLDKRAIHSEIKIIDSSGVIVTTIEGKTAEGTHKLEWDGTNYEGETLPDGRYTMFIEAAGVDGNMVKTEGYSFAKITAMEGSGTDITLHTEYGENVNFNSVLQVREIQNTTTNG